MTQLADSDVWYLTLRLPSGARFSYTLSPNDPLTIDPPRAATARGEHRRAIR